MKTQRAGIRFIDIETCYVEGCPSPHIDHEWYPNWKNADPRHDGEQHQPITRSVFNPATDKKTIGLRHWWHSVGSGYTGEQSEYILDPEVAKSMCEYELSRVGIDEDGRTYSHTSRLETFSLMLDELKHYNLVKRTPEEIARQWEAMK